MSQISSIIHLQHDKNINNITSIKVITKTANRGSPLVYGYGKTPH